MLGDKTERLSKKTKDKLDKLIKANVTPEHMKDIPLEHMFFCQLMSLGGTPSWSFERCFPKMVETTNEWENFAMELYQKYKPFIILNKKKLSTTSQAMPGTLDWIMSMYIVEALDMRKGSGDTNKSLKGMTELIKMKYDNRYKELLIEEKKIQIDAMKTPIDAEVEIIENLTVNDKNIEKLTLKQRKELSEKLFNNADEEDMQNKIFGKD